nr:hypothetical protein [Ciceribacter sp. L1K22]
MIPARLGSQRLKQKNLLELDGIPLVARAAKKAVNSKIFDEVWINSESDLIGDVAEKFGVSFHKRPANLGSNTATSEDFVGEFLNAHSCDYLVQVHSIAPLVTEDELRRFAKALTSGDYETLLSGVAEQIHCMYEGRPVNFSVESMNLTQEMVPVERVSWSLTGWNARTYVDAYIAKRCATFNGRIGFFPLSRPSGMVIKFEEDFRMIEALHNSGFGK